MQIAWNSFSADLSLYKIMNNESSELFSVMSSWNSFMTQASASASFICSDGFNSGPMSDTVSDNKNLLKTIFQGGDHDSTRSHHESNFPTSQASHGVQVTKTVTHKTCALDNRNCALDNRITLNERGNEAASACFDASVVKANKNEQVNVEKRSEEESNQGRAVLSTSRGENQLDENGNPIPVEETGSEVDDATCDVDQGRKPSRTPEDQPPDNSARSAEGKAPKGGKEVVRRGNKPQGKAQTKQKSLKSKRNDISAKARNSPEQGSGGEPADQGYGTEVKNQKQDHKSPTTRGTEADYHVEIDDEQQVVSLSETSSVRDDFNEAESVPIITDASFTGQQDSDTTDGTLLTESCQTIPEEKPSPSRSQARKKRRKGKQARSQNSKPDSTSLGVKISSVTSISSTDLILDKSSDVFPVSVTPTNSLKSVPFCVHQLSNAREKPSARVPPSRLTSVNSGLSPGVVNCALGEKNSCDLDEKFLDGSSIVEDKRIEGDGLCNVKDPDVLKVVSSGMFIVDIKSSLDLETSQPFKNDLSQGLSTEEAPNEILPERMPCVTVQAYPISPSRKQSTLIAHQGRVKPQSTVNPFSVLDSSASVKPLVTANQTLHPNPQARLRLEPTTGAKPKFNQPPRLRLRSLVNPLRVDQSQNSRVRPHPKFDSVSTPTDLPKPTPNDMLETRTSSSITDPNPSFRILRRRPFTPTPQPKHSDSSSSSVAETKNSVEQYSNGCYGNGCHSDNSPSIARTTIPSESCHRDNSTTKRADVAKKPQNSRMSDRKILDHNSITESVRSTTSGSSIDVESRSGDREPGSRVGRSICDRIPSGPRTSPKSMRTIVEHPTNSCCSQVTQDVLIFDLARAQQYLRTEFMKTIELKRRGGKVKILRL